MKVYCAWCDACINEGLADDDDTAISHGVCEGCLPALAADSGIPMDEFLDSLAPPIIIVQPGRHVLAANSAAKALMSKSHREITGQLGGYALGCVHADTPSSCGHAIHCMSCVIKNSVIHTMTTGEPLSNVPASPEIAILTGKRTVDFLISAKKVSGFVMVTIQDLQETQEVTSPREAFVGTGSA